MSQNTQWQNIYSMYSEAEEVVVEGTIWSIPDPLNGRAYLVRTLDGVEEDYPIRYSTSGVECWLLTPRQYADLY